MKVLIPGQDYRIDQRRDLREDIVRYYDESYWDYRTSWLNGQNLAIHYGYWDEETRSHHQALLNMNRALAESISLRPGCRVLDAGCGIGGSSIWLAEHFQARVTGITLSASQAELATKSARRRGVSELAEFQVMDFCATRFPDRSFDVIWGIESICHALDKQDFLREAFRLLRPGGFLVCSDGYATRREFNESEWRCVRICLDGWQIPNLATAQEFEGYLRDGGFCEIRFRDVTEHILPSSRRLWRTARLTYPMQRIMGFLGLRTAAQTGNFRTALHQYRVFRDGLACYGIFSAMKP